MLDGDAKRCLVEPRSIVLTESLANKYFNEEDPMGKLIESGDGNTYQVTGIIEDVPINSHLRFDGLISATTISDQVGADQFNSMEPGRFWNIGVYAYLLLNENATMDSIHANSLISMQNI